MSKSPEYSPTPAATSRTRLALLTLWAILTVAAIAFVATLGSNCPNADEWEFVPALTGNDPLGPWLWAQHNEHRLPLPRLVYYVLFQVTHDFRAGSFLQIALLAGTSLVLMNLAARLRGYPYWTDAFFPVSILHVGHWENFLIGYNICFAFILVLETAIGIIALRTTRETAFRSGVRAGFLMMMLCLCGGGGVVTAMPVALWLVYLAISIWRVVPIQPVVVHPALPPEAFIVNPIDQSASPAEKVLQLQKLTAANQPLVDAFLRRLDAKFRTRSNSNVKEPDRILAKAERPAIRSKQPWHDVEHIRDSFRFQTVLRDLRDLPAILHDLEANLGVTIIKRDTAKFLEPLEWGWRIVAFDLRMPNGQLVEYYLPVEELERAKNDGNHELFEKWRNRNYRMLSREERMELAQDMMESQARYEAAFATFLDRTGSSEKELRAALSKVSTSAGQSIRNPSPSGSSEGEKSSSGTQVEPPSRVDAAKPSVSSTQARPSPAREMPPTAISVPPVSNVTIANPARGANGKPGPQSALLFALAAFPFLYLALYLHNYHRPGHHPEVGQGGVNVLLVAGQVISIGFGSGIFRWWPPFLAALLVLGTATFLRLTQDLRQRENRAAVLGLLAIAAGIVGVALVIGMGRAGIDPRYGVASRYSYLSWPLLALCFLIWAGRGGRLGKWIPAALCIMAVLSFGPNMATGMKRGWDVRRGLAFIQDEARAGVPPEVIVRHFSTPQGQFQAHQEARAVRAMPLLRKAKVGAFAEGPR